MPFRVTTEPLVEPVTVTEAKRHCRVDGNDEDSDFDIFIAAARRQVEKWEWRSHLTQTLTLTLPRFPACQTIRLPRPPLQSVTSITYLDVDGDSQTVDSSDYIVDTANEPGIVVPAYGVSWPSTRSNHPAAVTIVYVAGYGDDPEDVPAETRQAIKLTIGHLYKNREAVVETEMGLEVLPIGVDAFLNPCHDARVLEFV